MVFIKASGYCFRFEELGDALSAQLMMEMKTAPPTIILPRVQLFALVQKQKREKGKKAHQCWNEG